MVQVEVLIFLVLIFAAAGYFYGRYIESKRAKKNMLDDINKSIDSLLSDNLVSEAAFDSGYAAGVSTERKYPNHLKLNSNLERKMNILPVPPENYLIRMDEKYNGKSKNNR